MALTRPDETDLLPALYEAFDEVPPWTTFLTRLRRRLRADQVAIVFGPSDTAAATITPFTAGHAQEGLVERIGRDLAAYRRLRPGRVYSAAEAVEHEGGVSPHFYGRILRIDERGGRGAWLAAARVDEDFAAADSALLSSLAPHLAILLRQIAKLERWRLRADAADAALARAGVGWATLDRDARVSEVGGQSGQMMGRRLVVPVEDDAVFVAEDDELLAIRSNDRGMLVTQPPLAVVLTRRALSQSPRHADALARLWNVSRGEARVALALARGLGLADAAQALGLTVETVRNYSKRLYARTGARGQADLVRRVLGSVAMLA